MNGGPSFVQRKAVNDVRVTLGELLGVEDLYALDRFDLEARTTLDAPAQAAVTAQLGRMADPGYLRCAGFGDRRPFLAQTAETQLGMVRLNVEALTALTRLALPGMMARGWGRVLNVASTAAFQPGPHMAVYYAAKAYVLSLSEALHEELRGTGVSSTALCPGPTRTGFADRAGRGSSILFRMSLDSASVAAAGYRGMMRGDAQVIPGWRNWIGAQVVGVAPRAFVRRVVSRLQGNR